MNPSERRQATYEEWTEAERAYSRAKSPNDKKRLEQRCAMLRDKHSAEEAVEARWLRDERLTDLAYASSFDGDFPKLHRKTHYKLPEALPDLAVVSLQMPAAVWEPRVRMRMKVKASTR